MVGDEAHTHRGHHSHAGAILGSTENQIAIPIAEMSGTELDLSYFASSGARVDNGLIGTYHLQA